MSSPVLSLLAGFFLTSSAFTFIVPGSVSTGIQLVLILFSLIFLVIFIGNAKNEGRRARRMSFSSEALAQGGFSKTTKMPPPIISAVLYFKELPSVLDLSALIEKELIIPYERFRCIPINKNGSGWRWEAPPHTVKALDHLFEFKANNLDEAHQLLEQIMLKPLFHSAKDKSINNDLRPRWEFDLIVTPGTDKKLLVARIDHSIADGISLVSVFQNMLTDKNLKPLPNLEPYKVSQKRSESILSRLSLLPSLLISFIKVVTLAQTKFDLPIPFNLTLKNNQNSNNNNNEDKDNNGDKGLEDPRKSLVFNGKRKIIFFPSLNLDFIKTVKNELNVTVNDVLMALTAGSIRRYSDKLSTSSNPSKLIDYSSGEVRALLPVAFPRSKSSSSPLRNLWCFVSSQLPISNPPENVIERIKDSNKINNKLKESPLAFVQLWVQNNIVSLLPLSLGQQTAYDIFTRHSMVFSNVPGPANEVYFAKQAIIEVQMVYPNLIPQVGILSYNGSVFMNMVADPTRVDGDLLVNCFKDEVRHLAQTLKIEVPTM